MGSLRPERANEFRLISRSTLRVSFTRRFLRSSSVFESSRRVVAVDAPGIKLFGVITGPTTINNQPAWLIRLDQLPDQEVALLPTSLRFEGQRSAARRPAAATTPAPVAEQIEDPDYIDDAVESSAPKAIRCRRRAGSLLARG